MNHKEYNQAVEKFSGRLYGFIVRTTWNEQNARDLVQDTFLKLWENREKVINDKAKSWLFTVAHNLTINFVKKHSRQDIVGDDYKLERGGGNNSNRRFEQQDVIDKCLLQLSPQQKNIVLLRDLEGYNYKEIGEMMKLNESQVKVYLFRARKKMKSIIKDISNAI